MKERMRDLLEGWAQSMGLNKIYGEFENEDQAAGFARGLDHVNDSAIDDIHVVEHKATGKWFVIFRDYDADDENEIMFTVDLDVKDYEYNSYQKVDL